MNNNKKKGFTLIELLVVIAILAILATVSIVGYTSFLNKARMSVDQQLTDQINNVIAAESVVQKPESYDDVVDILTENGYTSPLVPSYSKYVFAYLANENVMVLVENGAVVYPEKYAGTTLENVEYVVNSKDALDAALALEGNVKVDADFTYTTYNPSGLSNNENVVVNNKTTSITVSAGKTLTAGGSNGAIQATGSANVTLDGAGTVKADLGSDEYSMAVFATNNSVVYITNGYYTNETVEGSERGTDLIYARDNARIEISGGTFKAATPAWTLNCRDNSNAVIVVSGGMFYQFDPSNNTVGEGEVVVAEGYTVVRCDEDGTANDAGDWYKVVAE